MLLHTCYMTGSFWVHRAASSTLKAMALRKKRASKQAGIEKAEMLRVRLTTGQKVAFEAAAQRLGVGLSAFARMSMLERARAEGIEVKT